LIYELATAPTADQQAGDKQAQPKDATKSGAATAGGETITRLIAALNKRVDPSGTREVTIRKYGEREIEIIIPKANKQDLEWIERRISTAGALEFRITASRQFGKHRNYIEMAEKLPQGQDILRLEDGTAVAQWVEYDQREFGTPEQADR